MKILSANFSKGLKGTDPILYEPLPQIAFVGRSNVGKSSLMNCLLNSKGLVKSGKTPGKTKEINFFSINRNMYFVDLPGYGFSSVIADKREQFSKMIQWYLMEPIQKRKVVFVLDSRISPSELDIEMYRILRENNADIIIVANKIDTLSQKDRYANLKALSEAFPGNHIIPCSATTKYGREAIWKKILE